MLIKNSAVAMVVSVALITLAGGVAIMNVHAAKEEAVQSAGSTLENLMTAYNGESNANVRYLAFAKKANEEGYDIAASLFRAAAAAEQVHIDRTADAIKKLGGTPQAVIETPVVGTTQENLESAQKGETYENKVMYPAFLAQAKKDKNADAIDEFEDAEAAEGVHAQLYASMIRNLTFSRGLSKDFFVCPVCGNVVDSITTSMCPICMTDTKKFKRVN